MILDFLCLKVSDPVFPDFPDYFQIPKTQDEIPWQFPALEKYSFLTTPILFRIKSIGDVSDGSLNSYKTLS